MAMNQISDLGHYERFIDEPLSRLSNLTTGQVYQKVLADERQGTYLGRTIQVIPHITSFIKDRLLSAADRTKPDFMLIEIGGTVGDIEGEPYLEAARQFHREIGNSNVMFMLLTPCRILKHQVNLKLNQLKWQLKNFIVWVFSLMLFWRALITKLVRIYWKKLPCLPMYQNECHTLPYT